jgi:hypothetical protein
MNSCFFISINLSSDKQTDIVELKIKRFIYSKTLKRIFIIKYPCELFLEHSQ